MKPRLFNPDYKHISAVSVVRLAFMAYPNWNGCRSGRTWRSYLLHLERYRTAIKLRL